MCSRKYTHVYIYIIIYICVCAYRWYRCVCVSVLYIYICNVCNVCMYACMYVCMYVCICICIYIYIYRYTSLCLSLSLHVRVCARNVSVFLWTGMAMPVEASAQGRALIAGPPPTSGQCRRPYGHRVKFQAGLVESPFGRVFPQQSHWFWFRVSGDDQGIASMTCSMPYHTAAYSLFNSRK